MTNGQIMKLAIQGYKTIIPKQETTKHCVLGAAGYVKTGDIIRHDDCYRIFRRSAAFINGVMCGFDDGNKNSELGAYKTKRKKLMFLDGYKFGRKALKKFIPSKFKKSEVV